MDQPVPVGAAELYDALGEEYETAFRTQSELPSMIEWLVGQLPQKAKILDVGSGTGYPVSSMLADAGHDVTGCDVSPGMIDLARKRVPAARFELVDIRNWPYGRESFDVVISSFSILQLTRTELDRALADFAATLNPGGILMLGTVPLDLDEVGLEWMGHHIRVSSYPTEVFQQRLESHGLTIIYKKNARFEPLHELASPEEQLYLAARKSRPQA